MGQRGQFAYLIFAAASVLLALDLHGQNVTGLSAVRVATGITDPLFVTAPPGDFSRVFIVSRIGKISTMDLATKVVNPTAFLNIQSRISAVGEEGLLGMAFDPNFATNGKFYLNFLVPGGSQNHGTTRVSQFSLGSNSLGDANSEKILLSFDQLGGDHNGGWIGFSPRPNDDNNLYIATGDGGCCNDQGVGHIESGGNAQNLTTWFGKMLRIQVDSASGTYSIPPNNPFLETTGSKPEIWAYGLRNPFRDSFDRLTGRMFIGDVGQSTREEIDVQEPTNLHGGENYEWRLREGTIATPTGNPVVGGDRPPNGVDPIFDYPRTIGGSVIGGYVYRGRQIPALYGKYVFADYVTHKILVLSLNSPPTLQDITTDLFPTATGNFSLGAPASLGEDATGELYICDILNGAIFKIVPDAPTPGVTSIVKNGPASATVIDGFGASFTNVTVESTFTMGQAFAGPTSVAVGANGTFHYTDPAGPGHRFYRVRYP
ncbi:MAG: PQQ-dependent sugar dehydrogenase [Chthoniobacterales bacterium]